MWQDLFDLQIGVGDKILRALLIYLLLIVALRIVGKRELGQTNTLDLAPGLVTAGLLVFIAAWNEFLFATTLTSTPDRRTVPAAIAFFTGSQKFEVLLGAISAASVIVTIPLIVFVLLFQKRIVAGLTAGAVKG